MAQVKLRRQPPVKLPGKHEKLDMRDGWPVVMKYAGEGPGPWLADLSHCPRWDLQGGDLQQLVPAGLAVPESPGGAVMAEGMLVNRLGARQASAWLLSPAAAAPSGFGCTETTEAGLCLALIGKHVFDITEKLTALDLADSRRAPPFVVQGPLCHVTCQIAVLKNDPLDAVVLLACSRAYGRDMVHALLAAGDEFGLKPAGESRVRQALGLPAA
jgi:hypothetical protein